MRSILIVFILLLIGCLTAARADWGTPVVEELPFGASGFDLQESAVAVDHNGTLHLVWREPGADPLSQWLLYASKASDSAWSSPDTVNPRGPFGLNSAVIAVLPGDGTPVVAFMTTDVLWLAARSGPDFLLLVAVDSINGCCPSLAIDAQENVHLSWVQITGFETYALAYFVLPAGGPHLVDYLEGADLGGFGFGAEPSVAANEQGKAIIAYRGGDYPDYRISYAANDGLADTNWVYDQFVTPNAADYTPSLIYREPLGLYLAISGDDGWGMPAHVYYTWHDTEGGDWLPMELVTGAYSANGAVMAVTPDGTPHILSREVSGNIYTGNVLASSQGETGWSTQTVFQQVESGLNFVTDPAGYGHLICAAWNDAMELRMYHVRSETSLSEPVVAWEVSPAALQFPDTPIFDSETLPVTVINTGTVPLHVYCTDMMPPFFSVFDVPATLLPGEQIPVPIIFTSNTPGLFIDSVLISSADPDLSVWVRCEGRAVDLDAGDKPALLPREFAVEVYPNPFNPAAQIAIELPQAAQVNATVFDRLGRQVATLLNGELSAGAHRIAFDGSRLASGLYFVQVQAGTESRVIKAMLLR